MKMCVKGGGGSIIMIRIRKDNLALIFSMNKLKSLQNQARFNPTYSTPLSAVNADISPVKGRYKAVRMETSLVITAFCSLRSTYKTKSKALNYD